MSCPPLDRMASFKSSIENLREEVKEFRSEIWKRIDNDSLEVSNKLLSHLNGIVFDLFATKLGIVVVMSELEKGKK